MKQVKALMSMNVQVISPDQTIQEAAALMEKGGYGMMPVGENDRMIGALSDRDMVIRAIAQGKGPNTKVRDVMSPGIFWTFEEDSIDKAAEMMSKHQIRRLPIVNADKRLVGIVALGDFTVERSDIDVAGEALSEISKPA